MLHWHANIYLLRGYTFWVVGHLRASFWEIRKIPEYPSRVKMLKKFETRLGGYLISGIVDVQKLAPFTQLLGAKKGRENSNLGPFWEHRFCAHFVPWLRHGSCRQVGHKIPILGQCLGTLQPLTELDFVQIWQFYGHFRAILSALTPTAISRVPWVLDPRFLFRHVGGWYFYHSKKFG